MTIATVTDQGVWPLQGACRRLADLIVLSWYTLQVLFCVKGKDKKTEKPKFIADTKIDSGHSATRFDLVIIDESHLAKNTTSLRFQMGEILTTNCPTYLAFLAPLTVEIPPYPAGCICFWFYWGRTLGF